jgi:hypothetical protein
VVPSYDLVSMLECREDDDARAGGGKMLRWEVSCSRIGRVGDDTHGARYPYILIIKDTN